MVSDLDTTHLSADLRGERSASLVRVADALVLFVAPITMLIGFFSTALIDAAVAEVERMERLRTMTVSIFIRLTTYKWCDSRNRCIVRA